jgi:hypothetical protein
MFISYVLVLHNHQSLLLLTFRCRRFGGGASALAPYFAALDKWGPLWARLTYCLCAYGANLLPYLAVTR